MDFSIFLFLLQDGAISSAIYSLLAVAFVLLFTVTRIIFIPQGDLVAFGGLTLVALDGGAVPGSLWLMVALAGLAAVLDLVRHRGRPSRRFIIAFLTRDVLLPGAIVAATLLLAPLRLGSLISVPLTLAIIVPMGPFIYRIGFQGLANASVLTLLIAAVGVHWLLVGLSLVFFGAEGYRANPLVDASFALGPLLVPAQNIVAIGFTLAVLVTFYWFFAYTLDGKALRAAAISPRGARMVGISPATAGERAFAMAALIGAVSGVLAAPLTTLYYDSGFLIGLKGFVAAIVGGLTSYPMAVCGALFVGLTESFSAFFASAFKDVLVFSLILPVLLLRSLYAPHPEEG